MLSLPNFPGIGPNWPEACSRAWIPISDHQKIISATGTIDSGYFVPTELTFERDTPVAEKALSPPLINHTPLLANTTTPLEKGMRLQMFCASGIGTTPPSLAIRSEMSSDVGSAS